MAFSPENSLVLFVGDYNYYAKGSSRARAMEELGASVIGLPHTPAGNPRTGTPTITLYFRLLWKLGIHQDTEKVNAKIPPIVSIKKPDLVWIEKGNMVRAGTLRAIKARSPKTLIAGYSDDDMFHPINHTSAYVKSLPYYDVIFTTKSYNANAEELPALGARQVRMVDKAYDPDQHRILQLTESEKSELEADVSFIGSFAPERGEILDFLAKNGISITVWGNGWESFEPVSKNLTIKRQALVNTPQDLRYSKGINASRINLGFLRKINRDLQTDRSVEIPACGGFLLAERSGEHEQLFEDGKEAVFFATQDELLAKIRYYLANDQERAAIANAGHGRCKKGYSHCDRVAQMLSQLPDHQS